MGRRNFKTTVLSFFVLLAMATAVGFLYLLEREEIYATIKKNDQELVDKEQKYHNGLTEQWSEVLTEISVHRDFLSFVNAYIVDKANISAETQGNIEHLFSEITRFESNAIHSVRFVDVNGFERAMAEKGSIVRDYQNVAEEPFFKQSISQEKNTRFNVVFDSQLSTAFMHLSHPVLSRNQTVGVLTVSIDINSLLQKYGYFISANLMQHVIMLSKQGEVIYAIPNRNYSPKEIKKVFGVIKQNNAKSLVVEYQNNIWSYLANEELGFYILFEAKGKELLSQLNYKYNILAIVVSSGALLLLLVIFATTRRGVSENLMSSKRAMKDQRSFHFSSISDEIRPPINTLLGSLSTLTEVSKLDEKQLFYVGAAKKSADYLLELVNEFQDFSKINKGEFQLEEIEFDLRTTVHDVAELMSAQAYKKGLEVSCLVNSNVPLRVIGDATRLRQVMINLISFAVKYTEHGEISIFVSSKGNDYANKTINIDISDTGNIVDQETMLEHFKLLTDVRNYNQPSYGSKGLGLALSTQILEMMDGEIDVKENNAGGNTFAIQLPMKVGRVGEPAKPKDNLANKRVLIVGEVERNRLSLSKALGTWGMSGASMDEFSRVSNVLREAKFNNKDFRVCMIDVSLSSSSDKAFSVVKKIRKEFSEFELALIVLTGQGKPGDAKIAKELGVQAYLTKPLTRDTVHDSLLEVLGVTASNVAKIVTRHTLKEGSNKEIPKILVAEFDAENQKRLVKFFKKKGFLIDVALNGNMVDSAVKINNYSMILLDIRLPRLDVFRFARDYRQSEHIYNQSIDIDSQSQKHVPIIAIVNRSDSVEIEKCRKSGLDDLVLKPIIETELDALVQDYLELHKTA